LVKYASTFALHTFQSSRNVAPLRLEPRRGRRAGWKDSRYQLTATRHVCQATRILPLDTADGVAFGRLGPCHPCWIPLHGLEDRCEKAFSSMDFTQADGRCRANIRCAASYEETRLQNFKGKAPCPRAYGWRLNRAVRRFRVEGP
jgi:hypothetical protein